MGQRPGLFWGHNTQFVVGLIGMGLLEFAAFGSGFRLHKALVCLMGERTWQTPSSASLESCTSFC